MIDSQAPIQFWGEAVNTAVHLHQRSPNDGLRRRNDRDDYQAPYKTPYEILHRFGKAMHDANGNEISYKAPLHNLQRFECYASRLIPEVQGHQGKFGPRSKPCMMVSYTHDSKTLWRIWDPEFQKVKAKSEVIFNEERNAHMSCQPGSNEIDMFGLPEDEEYVDEKDTGDEPLRDSQPTQIDKRSTYHMHTAPDEEAENIAHSRRLRREDQTAQHSAADAENIVHSRRLRRHDQTAQRLSADAENIACCRRIRCEDQTAWHLAAAIKKSYQPPPASPAPPIASRVTRSQGKASAEELMASIEDPFTYAEAMESPQRDRLKRAIEEESP